jgi:hypothetical protein
VEPLEHAVKQHTKQQTADPGNKQGGSYDSEVRGHLGALRKPKKAAMQSAQTKTTSCVGRACNMNEPATGALADVTCTTGAVPAGQGATVYAAGWQV